MIKKIILLFFCLGMFLIGITQQIKSAVISAAGEVSKTGKMYVEWTLGESFVESIFSANHLYTQGFHQPIKTKSRALRTLPINQEWSKITVLPNPVRTTGKIRIERGSSSGLHILLADVTGKPILNRISFAPDQVVDFNLAAYPSGIYTLTIRTANGSLYKTFKIIKVS